MLGDQLFPEGVLQDVWSGGYVKSYNTEINSDVLVLKAIMEA